MLSALVLPGVARAHGGGTFQAGPTSTPPTIDGTIGATEWQDAPVNSLSFGGMPATIRMEHTATTLYVAVTVQDLAPSPSPSLSIYVDNGHTGAAALGDDGWDSSPGDSFYDPSGSSGAGWYSDLGAGGTDDTIASTTSASGNVTFELAHPLCSADTAHDFCLSAGATFGMNLKYWSGNAVALPILAPGTSLTDMSASWADVTLATTDVVHPSVTLTTPTVGSVLSGTVPLAADASDNVGVTKVDFEYFDGSSFHVIGTDTTAPYTGTFDTTAYPNTSPGGGSVFAVAYDAAGNSYANGVAVTIDNATGSLTGTLSAPTPVASGIDLTAAGAEDWAVWGDGSSTSLTPDVRKSGGSAISNLTVSSGAVRNFGSDPANPYTFAWSDGDPVAAATAATTGLTDPALGTNASFTVPADTALRRLTLWTSAHFATGTLTASLSDGSATPYTATLTGTEASPGPSQNYPGVFTIEYRAGTAGQHLTVTWVESAQSCGGVCDDVVLYAAALSKVVTVTGVSSSLETGSTVEMSGSNDRLTDLPLRAFEPSVPGVTPAPINGLPINGLPINGLPINGLPINGLPINGLPINGLPINGLPINGLPINGLPINGLPINGLPINGLPLNLPGGWQALLAGTSLAGVPLQSITLQQVLDLHTAATNRLTLGDLDLSNSAFGRLTIGALALGATPINGLGLPSDAFAALLSWCQSVAPSCTAAALGNQSLFALGLAGAPINGLPINGLPINGLPINGLPINGLPINGLDVSASPINGLPINGLTLAGTPINGLSLAGILAAHAPDGSASLFGRIPISALANPTAVDCTLVDCATGTLADAVAAGAVKDTATLGDLGAAALGSLTLGDLHYYGTLTIGDLLQSLVGTNVTLGDLIGLLIKRADVPWETLSPRLLSVFDPSRPKVTIGASFTLAGTGTGDVTVKLQLPPGFDVVPGSATLQNGDGTPGPVADPTILKGGIARWELPSVAVGPTQTLSFDAWSGTTLGPAQVTEQVTSGGSTSQSTASLTVTDSFEPNDNPSAPSLPTITPDTAVQQSAIGSRGDVDYYKVPLPPAGTRLEVHLTNLPADYDLALYSSQTTSVRTGATSGAPLQDGTVPDQSIDLSGGVNPQLTPTALQDVPNPGIPAVQVSANRGTDDEDVGMVSPGGGGYALIAVYGYNGAWSAQPYSLRVTTQAPVTPTCPARTFPDAGAGTAGTLPAIGSLPSDLNTLILVDEKRIGDTYGATAESDVAGALTRLAGDRALGVSGAVVPVEALAQSQYDAWDANPCDAGAANGVANAIADEIDRVKAARPALRYVVFAGGDDQIPFFRIPDLSRIANENGFAGQFAQNEYYGALASGDLLTDNPYLDTRPIPASGRQLFVPDLLGGRLVEKPGQIVAAVSRFESSNGTLQRSTAFVSGYDFVSDGSQRVQANLDSFLGTGATRTLIGDTWSKSDLLGAAFGSGGPADINDWNGHYDNYEALPANGDRTNLLTTADLTGPYALSGGIFFTMGCHAGFQTTDAIVGASAPDALDWAEAFARSGTSFVGNTGFGLGNTDSVAFSEELMADLAANLGRPISIGEALADAKQSYYLARTAFSSYDEKTLSEAELYGLPMYGLGAPPPALASAGTGVVSPSPDPVRGATDSTSPSQGTLSPLPSTSADVASFSVTPHFSSVQTGDHGQYVTNDGQVQAPNYRPLQPFVSLPAARPGTVAHGVLIDSLTSSDITPFTPDNVRPTLDLSANEPAPQFAQEAWPTKVPTLVSLEGANGLQQSLNLTTGQFFTDSSSAQGVEREWTQIAGRVTYSSSSDFVPPSIDSIDAYLANGTVSFSGRFSDLTETGATGTVALAQVVYDVDNGGTWRALSLVHDSSTDTWSGGASFSGTHVQFFVEACDVAGNCGFSSNKGRYFDAQALPSSNGAVSITPSRAPDKGSWYTGPLDVTATASDGATVSASVDGAAFAPATGPIALSGEGVHTVDARASNGSETTAVFLVDAVGPTITHTVDPAAPDGANGWYVTAPTVSFACVDDLSGVLAGSCSIDGSSPAATTTTLGQSAAPQTVSASAADNAGNVGHDSATGLKVDLDDPAVPSFTGIQTTIYPVKDVPPASAIGCASSDAASGLASCVVTGYGSSLGAHTLVATATDNAGRTSTASLTYVVGFEVGDALPPLTRSLRTFQVPQTIPVKYRLYLDAARTMLLQRPPAGSLARLALGRDGGGVVRTDTFRWTGATDFQYIDNLSTKGLAAGTYWVTLELVAADGTVLARSERQYFLLR